MQRNALRLAAVLLTAAALSACGSNKSRSDGPGSTRVESLPGDAIPRQEPRSRYGNGPIYEVFGKTYTVMPSSRGYHERGVASWYGKKFHGNMTSNREVYDMYGMTAAHKSLPLPTYVRVRNLRNNKSIVVRVNDRGPFVSNRIIDLSYAAALKLDMVKAGTSLVEVTAIDFNAAGEPVATMPRAPEPIKTVEPPPAPPPTPRVLRSIPSVTEDEPTAVEQPTVTSHPATASDAQLQISVQIGAFGERANADRRLRALQQAGITDGYIFEDTSASALLYRVRIGPVNGVAEYDVLVAKLQAIGITDPYLVSE